MKTSSTLYFAVIAFILLMAAPSFGQVLNQSGPCPGTKTFTASGMTPGGDVAFIRAFGTGNVTIPGGLVCFGTQLGLNGTATLAAFIVANGSGVATLVANVPLVACGNVYLQALDLTTCTPTNVILIQ